MPAKEENTVPAVEQTTAPIIVDDVQQQELVVNQADCERIREIGTERPYKDTKEGSRFEGKSYRTFTYRNKPFIVPSDDRFCTDFDNDNLFEVEFIVEEEWLTFVNHRAITRAIRTHETSIKMKAFTVAFVQSKREINPEELL